ncbi:MAG: SulP family inorganic anion transporter [Vicingaceae bacterium]
MPTEAPEGYRDFKKFWHKDLSSAFVVSLIALPLSLSLAAASGVPPMAGIIACVVGGIVLSFIGGSYVTISGPGNGLVVVVLSAVTSLGAGDMLMGYTYTLAAIVCSGLIIMLMGFLRLGNLSDFFPSASIQGLLSAIGLILIAKQVHVMLGEKGVEAANNLFLLIKIPESLYALSQSPEVPYVGIIGLCSLFIMWAYPKIPWRSLHTIPAPMWIVLFAIGFYYYFDLLSESAFPIAADFLIQLPDQIGDSITFPNFDKIADGAFFQAVIGITLIATIESLLSIKAVDKLDEHSRRSNANKDLRALGLSTTLSGLIGGLPVVAVIARSSVNVNQGAQFRTANLFHSLFVAAFVLLFGSVLNVIPLSALAGILVYTGYRLASPTVFKRMYKSGVDQFIVFLITLVATLLFGLVNGILLGILATFVAQIIMMKGRRDFLMHPLRPNLLMYQEEDGKLYLSMKGHATFLNYIALKKQLDSVPPNSQLTLDLSLTKFVDNSVMENIDQYQKEYKKHQSQLEVIGLDVHDATSSHPFAARRILKLRKMMEQSGILTDRQQMLKEFAKEIDWNFRTNSVFDVPDLKAFPFFATKEIDHAYNMFKGEYQNRRLKLMDVEFYEGELVSREKHKQTVMLFELKQEFPAFRLDKERVLDRLADIAGFHDINFENHKDFSRRFTLRGDDEQQIRAFFNDDLILFFESNPYYHLECNGKSILIVKGLRLATISEVKALANYGKGLMDIMDKMSVPTG